MSTNQTRRTGKNEQPLCASCGPSATHNMTQWKQEACVTNKRLNNLGAFFSDPASYPGSSQSPVTSPTPFPLLFDSPVDNLLLYPPVVYAALPNDNAILIVNRYGQLLRETSTQIITATIRTRIVTTLSNPASFFVLLPTTVSDSQTIVSGSLFIQCTSIGGVLSTQNITTPVGLVSNGGRVYVQFDGTFLSQNDSCVFTLNLTLTNA